MELHKALRHIVQTEGQGILKEIRLINLLDDFNAFQDISATKYILKAIITEGYSTKLLAVGTWNNTSEMLSAKFSSIMGFIPSYVHLIFQAIAYSLNWINDIPSISSNNTPTASPTGINDFKSLSLIEQEDIISDLIRIDPIIVDTLDISVTVSASITNPTLYLNVELSGNIMQNGVNIHAILYNKRGLMKDVKTICCLDRSINTSVARFKIFFDGVLIIKNGKSIIDYKCVDHNIGNILITSNLTNDSQAHNFEVRL